MRIALALLLCCVVLVLSKLQETADGSVCANQCSGHGNCIDYHCKCYTGYHGDSCAVTFGDESNLIPILSAGHFNITRKNYTSTLVGFSSYTCFKCIQAEPEYEILSKELAAMKIPIPFGRMNVDKAKSIANEHGINELPRLIYFKKQKPIPYHGYTDARSVVEFIRKVTGSPFKILHSIEDVDSFITSRVANLDEAPISLSKVVVIGFFSEYEDVEEDDYSDFVDTAKQLQDKEDIYFGVVIDADVSEYYKSTMKIIDRTPSVYAVGESGLPYSINLDEFVDYSLGLSEWIISKSVPLVGQITPHNFQMYNKINKPMLMLFLDLSDSGGVVPGSNMVGGKSGEILNELLLGEMRLVAQELGDKILFVYADGNAYADQMRSLGLYGGAERLPAMAFNTRESIQAPFPEEFGINKDTVVQFCADFLTGKIRSPADSQSFAKKQLAHSTPVNNKNKAVRREPKKPPPVERGVAEGFGDGAAGDNAVVEVTAKNFDEICMNEDKDVLLMIYAQECELCFNFAVYYKRMAGRFKDLRIRSLVVARMDITHETPPPHLNILTGHLPELVMLPSTAKHSPWQYYSGVGKVQEMMLWVQSQAGIPFELPNLPHLNVDQVKLYKEQIREREVSRDKKREEDADAIAMEDAARAKYQHQNSGTGGGGGTGGTPIVPIVDLEELEELQELEGELDNDEF
mgnify:FL=1